MGTLPRMTRPALLTAAALALATIQPAPGEAQESAAPTPDSIIAAAPPGDWTAIAPDDLLVMNLAPDAQGRPRNVVIQLLPPPYSQGWVENIRSLAAAHWWDGTSVYRVVDNWVAQWGDGEDEKADAKPLPPGLNGVPESAYVVPLPRADTPDQGGQSVLARAGVAGRVVSTRDPYAPLTTFENGWPIGVTFDSKWPTHCYGTVAWRATCRQTPAPAPSCTRSSATPRASSTATSPWWAG